MFVLLLTLVSAEKMETFINKNWTTGVTAGGHPFTFTENNMETILIPTAGLNHGGTEGSLIHTHLAMETTPLLLPEDQLMLSSATSLDQKDKQKDMQSTSRKCNQAALTADTVLATILVGISTDHCQDDGKMEHNINTTTSASATTAPINSTLSLASFTAFTGKKGRERRLGERTREREDLSKNDNDNNNHDNNNNDVSASTVDVESSSSLTTTTTTTVNDCFQELEGVIKVMENSSTSTISPSSTSGATSIASSEERCGLNFFFF